MLGLRFCARAFSSCGERGPLFIAVRGPLTVAASLVAEHRLQTCRLSNRGSRAQLLRGMWDPPRPGLEPVSSALAGRFSTTAPPGKPPACFLNKVLLAQSHTHLKKKKKRNGDEFSPKHLQTHDWQWALSCGLPESSYLLGVLWPPLPCLHPCAE